MQPCLSLLHHVLPCQLAHGTADAGGLPGTAMLTCSMLAVGKILGDIRVNGHPWEVATFARVSGYVEQTDVHLPYATVREAVLFSAQMRFPRSVPRITMEAFTDEVGPSRGSGLPGSCGPNTCTRCAAKPGTALPAEDALHASPVWALCKARSRADGRLVTDDAPRCAGDGPGGAGGAEQGHHRHARLGPQHRGAQALQHRRRAGRQPRCSPQPLAGQPCLNGLRAALDLPVWGRARWPAVPWCGAAAAQLLLLVLWEAVWGAGLGHAAAGPMRVWALSGRGVQGCVLCCAA